MTATPKSIAACAAEADIAPSTLRYRLQKGQTLETAMATPLRKVNLNVIGEKRGLLTIQRYVGKNARGLHIWDCSCECGTLSVIVSDAHTKSGNTASCGCLKKEADRRLAEKSATRTAVHEIGGERYSISGLSKISGVARSTLRKRLATLSPQEALGTMVPETRRGSESSPDNGREALPAPHVPVGTRIAAVEPTPDRSVAPPSSQSPLTKVPAVSSRPRDTALSAAGASGGPVRRLEVIQEGQVTRREDIFACKPFAAKLSAGSCLDRQHAAHGADGGGVGSRYVEARQVANRLVRCARCPQGAQRTTPWKRHDSMTLLPGPGEPDVAYLVDLSSWRRPAHAVAGAEAVVRTVVSKLVTLLRGRRPAYLAFAADSPGPTWHHALWAGYHASRTPAPPEYWAEHNAAIEILGLHRIPVWRESGYTADDFIATGTARARAAGLQVVIVGKDHDLWQLVDGCDVMVWSGDGDEAVDEEHVRRACEGIGPRLLPDLWALEGPKEQAPGVPGIGRTTAARILRRHTWDEHDDLLEEVLRKWSWEKGKIGFALRNHADEARLGRRLVTLKADAPIEWNLGELAVGWNEHDARKLRKRGHALGIRVMQGVEDMPKRWGRS